jgi:hypothetical protein
VGDHVKVTYVRQAGEHADYYATDIESEVELDDEDDDDEEEFDGKVTGLVEQIDSGSMRLKVAGIWYQVDGATKFDTDCGGFTRIGVGDEVKIEYHVLSPDLERYAEEIEVMGIDDCDV